jgi:hypothetical protein
MIMVVLMIMTHCAVCANGLKTHVLNLCHGTSLCTVVLPDRLVS